MKLAFREIEPFIKAPNPAARVILIYGPEPGLMRERSQTIGKTIVADLNDPFNAVTLTNDQLLQDPARLMDEALAMSMMGGGRLIRVQDAADSLTPLIKDYLQSPSAENLILLEAAELGPKSPLRLLCEKAGNAAALPCYVEEERDIAALIRQIIGDSGQKADGDAVSYLAATLAGDRRRVRGEIEKLLIYKGAAPGPITLEDAQDACFDSSLHSLDVLVYSVAGAQPEAALKAFQTMIQEGVSVIAMLRALQRHFRRLHLTKARVAQGLPLDQALKSLTPPIFFKQEPAFRAQTTRWSLDALTRALARLASTEAACKKTNTPAETLTAQAILSLSSR